MINKNATDKTTGNITDKNQPKGIFGKILQFIIPIVITVGLCVAMFRDIDFGSMIELIKTSCDFSWIALMLAISFLPLLFRAMRWGIQLKAASINAPLKVLLCSIIGTYAVNIVFPRLGEVWRTGYISYRQNAPFSTVLGSMISDRFADLLAVALLTLATFAIATEPLLDFIKTYPQAYNAVTAIVTSPFTWITVILLIAAIWWAFTRSKNGFILKIKNFASGLWQGFVSIARMNGKAKWLILTISIWLCYFLGFLVAFKSFPITDNLLETRGLLLPLVGFILTSISMGIPSNGGIGPYQTALIFGLMLFVPEGADTETFKTTGAALGNVMIAAQTLMFIILGVIAFAVIAIDKRHRDRTEA